MAAVRDPVCMSMWIQGTYKTASRLAMSHDSLSVLASTGYNYIACCHRVFHAIVCMFIHICQIREIHSCLALHFHRTFCQSASDVKSVVAKGLLMLSFVLVRLPVCLLCDCS